MRSRLVLRCFPLAAALSLAGALTGCGNESRIPGKIALADCRLPKLSTAARCGSLEVPEDRSKPDGRRITLFVAVLPANTLSPKPDPLVIIAGGPGQSATSLAPFAARLVEVRRTRDIVLIDQRGTGRSSPLACAAFAPDDDPEAALETDPGPRARLCAAELGAKGIDLRQYTTAAWVADLDTVRASLGYPRWNLWGGSYGTRVALDYLRRHGERVRTMVLDGVAPPSLKVSFGVWITREQQLEAIFDTCAGNAACRDRHPALRSALDDIRHDLGPAGREVLGVDPRTGEARSMKLTFDAVLSGLHPLTYIPELASAIPEILQRAADDDWGPLFAVAQMVTTDIAEQMSVALHYAVTCSEDAPRVDAADRAKLAGLRSEALALKVLAACADWPTGTPPTDFTEPVQSNVPVLMLSGALDPVTPPAYAEEVGRSLPNSRHVVANGYGHIVSSQACAPRLIASFVDRAGFDALPQACLDHFAKSTRPPLWADQLAPSP